MTIRNLHSMTRSGLHRSKLLDFVLLVLSTPLSSAGWPLNPPQAWFLMLQLDSETRMTAANSRVPRPRGPPITYAQRLDELQQLWKADLESGVTLILRGDEPLTYEEHAAMYAAIHNWCTMADPPTLQRQRGTLHLFGLTWRECTLRII